ncbi:MAG: DinB family protein [Parafilimonas sp.]
MKKIILLLLLPAMFSSFTASTKTSITEEEKKFAINHLKQTQSDLLEAVHGLTDAQLNFKTAPDRWSVLECVQHITLASAGLWQMAEASLKESNDSALKSQVADDQLIKIVEDRSMKAQAPEPFKPIKSPYHTLDETLEAFQKDRNKLIEYIKSTNDDMRAHIAKMPFGNIDAFQVVLMISAHTNRHTQQINEVKADPNFPK